MIMGRELIKQCLNDGSLRAYRCELRLAEEELVIGTNSVDVTLSNKFCIVRLAHGYYAIDPYDPASLETEYFEAEVLNLEPGEAILGCTRERFAIGKVPYGGVFHHVAPMYDGRSTCGRLFLASHITAGYGDVGFQSAWTLEIKNMGQAPLILHSGMRIGQVSFRLVAGEVGEAYAGAYTSQHSGPRPPQLGLDRF